MTQNEIHEPISLLDDTGLPKCFGWSRQANFLYEPEMVYAPRHKITESDRYIVHSPTHMVVFEIKDDSWLGYMGISIISLREKKRFTQIYNSFIPFGAYKMPNSSISGSVRWQRKKTHLDFINMDGGRIIKADIPKYEPNRSMRCALVLYEPEEAQSIMISQSYHNSKNAFRLSLCSPWFFVEGVIQFGSTEIVFTRGHAWGILDWNRNVRPKADILYWAAACGQSEGRLLGFCVGYSWANFSQGSENGFFIDGVLHKLNQVTFHIPSNWLSPWRFTSNDNRLEMTFYPHQERNDRHRFFLHSSTRRQVFGFFSGKAQLDDGSVIEFHNLTGFAERSKIRN
ncbi:MAG: DUF2804 domain-containing protein [Treponema sp.]|jgi:hypothetical protein|nr:DUF2804 domain-containing protein [Treponema sp.]